MTGYEMALQAALVTADKERVAMAAPIDATRDDLERLWLAAEMAANTVRRLAVVEQ